MKRGGRVVLGSVLLLSMAAILYFGAQRILEQQRIRHEVERLRDELYRARVAATRCRQGLSDAERQIQEFRGRLDSMRARVDSFEALHPRGVPEAVYEPYLEAFDTYNDSVAAWDTLEMRIRTQEAACRDAVARHNALRDSLERFLAASGIEVR